MTTLDFVHGETFSSDDGLFRIHFTGVRLGLQAYRAFIYIEENPETATYVLHPGTAEGDFISIRFGGDKMKKLEIYCSTPEELEDRIYGFFPDLNQDFFMLR